MVSYHDANLKGGPVTALYHSQDISLPVGYHLIKKTKTVSGKKGPKKVSEQTKQHLCRDLIRQALVNQLAFKYVLADSWYGSVETINYLISKEKQFIFALKSNRHVALSETDNQQGQHRSMSELGWEETTTHRVWLAGLQTALELARLVFANRDGTRGALYLLTNDLTTDAVQIHSTYRLRWKVEPGRRSGVLQIDQVQHGLCVFTHPPSTYPKQPFVFIDGGLCETGSDSGLNAPESF